MKYKDYYKILGVKRNTDKADIKKSFRRLARKYHPDVSKDANAEEKFKEINEAYEVLKDDKKRAQYDQLGNSWRDGQSFSPPPGWQGKGNANFSDLFESFFQRARNNVGANTATSTYKFKTANNYTRSQAKGSDLQVQVHISLEDAYHGVERMVSLPGNDKRQLKVKIPKGITEGQKIRLTGQGKPGPGGKGDLFLEVCFQEHKLFQVTGKDIHLDIPLSPWEAAMGTVLSVPTLNGTIDIRIPENTSSGKKLRLRNRGLPGKEPGNQFITLYIQTPPADSQEVKELYMKLAQITGFNPRKEMYY